jgi:uncharacterized repeat protein (TIGR03803 family)
MEATMKSRLHLFTRLGVALREAWVLPALIAVLDLMPAGRVTAQTFTTLHRFHGNDGATPFASLILSGNTLYGTASSGGSADNGTVFAVNSDGTGFTNLHSFAAGNTNSSGVYTNRDGTGPEAGLMVSGNTLYGTAKYGGSSGNGTLFAVNTDGTGFTNLHSFAATYDFYHTNSDGANPAAGLILSGNTLYGTAEFGGNSGNGTVFADATDGTGFTNLHSFTALSVPYPGTNTDGIEPLAGLILAGNSLYGTAVQGGRSGLGTVFKLNTDGTGFTTLYSFSAGSNNSLGDFTNSDGNQPKAGLILSGNTLYGTAHGGGSSGRGAVFAINTDGEGFTNLHSFTAISDPYFTNRDGANPDAGLVLSGNTLYGTAVGGGSSGGGTVFAVHTDGTGFTILHSFGYDSITILPAGGLVLSGDTLYGTASDYFTPFDGTVFSLSFQPQLTIIPSGPNVILSWSTNVSGFDYTGYTLQSTTNLAPSPVWTANSPAPVVVNGQNTVTNPISGAQKFYRLSQ